MPARKFVAFAALVGALLLAPPVLTTAEAPDGGVTASTAVTASAVPAVKPPNDPWD